MTTPNGSKPLVVDSWGWVEYLADGPRAAEFVPYLTDEGRIVVPTIVIYEVAKKLLREAGETVVNLFLSHALRCRVVYLDEMLALEAARLSLDHRLPMADAVIYATARAAGAELVTGDLHFRGLAGVTLL